MKCDFKTTHHNSDCDCRVDTVDPICDSDEEIESGKMCINLLAIFNGITFTDAQLNGSYDGYGLTFVSRNKHVLNVYCLL